MATADERWLSEAMSDARYARIDETVPTFLAADTAALAALKTKHSPSPIKPVRAYDQAAKQFKICLGGAWLVEDEVTIVDGVGYANRGHVDVLVNTVGGNTAVYWETDKTVTMPFTPPPGYYFVFTGVKSPAAMMTISNHSGETTSTPKVNISTNVARTDYDARLYWELRKQSS